MAHCSNGMISILGGKKSIVYKALIIIDFATVYLFATVG